MKQAKLSSRQLRAAAGISRVTHDQWRARGFINAETSSGGTGHPQLYSFDEIMRAAILRRLVALGVTVGRAAEYVRHIYGFKGERAWLVIWKPESIDVTTTGAKRQVTHWSPDLPTISKVTRHTKLSAKLIENGESIVVCLDTIEARVKEALEEGDDG